jgi:hypothetical protein
VSSALPSGHLSAMRQARGAAALSVHEFPPLPQPLQALPRFSAPFHPHPLRPPPYFAGRLRRGRVSRRRRAGGGRRLRPVLVRRDRGGRAQRFLSATTGRACWNEHTSGTGEGGQAVASRPCRGSRGFRNRSRATERARTEIAEAAAARSRHFEDPATSRPPSSPTFTTRPQGAGTHPRAISQRRKVSDEYARLHRPALLARSRPPACGNRPIALNPAFRYVPGITRQGG